MRMFNNCRFGLLTVAFVAALTMSTFGAVASAADSNKDGKISAADLTRICKHVLGEVTIEQ